MRARLETVEEFELSIIRYEQAERLWSLRWSAADDYFSYLRTVPPLPPCPHWAKGRFDLPVLVDRGIGLWDACRLVGVGFMGDQRTFVDGQRYRTDGMYWIWCQDGRRNLGRTPKSCRETLGPNEVCLTALEGMALFIQFPRMVHEGHFIDLPGSSLGFAPVVPCIGRWTGRRVWLHWIPESAFHPLCGSATRAAF